MMFSCLRLMCNPRFIAWPWPLAWRTCSFYPLLLVIPFVDIDGEGMASPHLLTLPMGWSWAVLFCQSVVRNTFRRSLDERVQRISDRGVNVHVSKGHDAEATYVDNFCLLSCDKSLVEDCASEAVAAMDAIGLGCHVASSASECAEFTGLLFDGIEGCVRVSHKRVWRLHLCFLGHYTCCALLRREALAVPSSMYAFASKGFSSPVKLWESVLREARWMDALSPVLCHDMRSDWHAQVHCSDASDTGYGVCAAWSDPGSLACIGRLDERWRFRTEEAVQARGLIPVDLLFLRACRMLLPRNLSRRCFGRRWPTALQSKDICRLEGKALVMSVKHALRRPDCFRKHVVCLVDNMSLCLALNKGRACSMDLLSTCREVCCLSPFALIRVHVRWIPSELNPSDNPSRRLGRPKVGRELLNYALAAGEVELQNELEVRACRDLERDCLEQLRRFPLVRN
eukprot:2028582-Amphidinium_carterae.3